MSVLSPELDMFVPTDLDLCLAEIRDILKERTKMVSDGLEAL